MGLTEIPGSGQQGLPDKEDLLIPSIATSHELNELEQLNIQQAIRWTIQRRRKFTPTEVLTERFIKDLHRRMFGLVWKNAGHFKDSGKEGEPDKYLIGRELRLLLDDIRYWIGNQTYTEDMIAVRFQHRLGSIRCFANGNARHSRLMGDLLIEKIFGKQPFSWGGATIGADNIRMENPRAVYTASLQEADAGKFEPLLQFARS
ncbi:MAG TPA: mobile mystery protein B [Puia sp.]|nr:mobile mystery protein B [Puia sp.]